MRHKIVWVNITTEEGELLDRFPVCHWHSQAHQDLDNAEAVGSPLSNSDLARRIERYVAEGN